MEKLFDDYFSSLFLIERIQTKSAEWRHAKILHVEFHQNLYKKL
jgi:hypothetical protein